MVAKNDLGLCSSGEIATMVGAPFHRVQYAIRRLGITPAARVGGRILYYKTDASRIGAMLRDVDTKRQLVKRAVRSVQAGGGDIRLADEMEAANAE